MKIRIGILALQGAFQEHAHSLAKIGVEPVIVKWPNQLDNIEGLIIPGGESTTIGKLMAAHHFIKPLKHLILEGLPVYGSCAGLIVLAKEVIGSTQPILGVMDIVVYRNAFGRQRESFEERLIIPVLGERPFNGIFIRAPIIKEIGKDVQVLAKLKDGTIVAAEQRNIIVTAFHPELTDDLRFHRYFLDKIGVAV